MGDQVQTDGQNANGQGNSDPPEWFQAFAQQIGAHMTHMTQRMSTIEQQAQGQPQVQPPPPPPAPPADSAAPTPAGTLVSDEQTQRPRHKLPEMKMFTGKRSEWRAWKNKMEQKLDRDRLAIGNEKDRFAYIDACLDDTPAQMVLAYVERQREKSTEDPDHFMAYLNSIYGNTNTKEYAVNKLNTMSQGKEAFATFLPKFETTLADAGGGEWTDEVKINTLKRTLNQEMRKSFIYMPAQPTEYSAFIDSMQTLASRLAAFDRESRKLIVPTVPMSAPILDEMDWQPSTRKAQVPTSNQSERKRAQWVSKDVLEERRANNKCLRCGNSNHFVRSCRLLPPRPPQQGQTKVKPTSVKNDVKDDNEETTVVEELNSDTESGKE